MTMSATLAAAVAAILLLASSAVAGEVYWPEEQKLIVPLVGVKIDFGRPRQPSRVEVGPQVSLREIQRNNKPEPVVGLGFSQERFPELPEWGELLRPAFR
jgi:hypothetical protein